MGLLSRSTVQLWDRLFSPEYCSSWVRPFMATDMAVRYLSLPTSRFLFSRKPTRISSTMVLRLMEGNVRAALTMRLYSERVPVREVFISRKKSLQGRLMCVPRRCETSLGAGNEVIRYIHEYDYLTFRIGLIAQDFQIFLNPSAGKRLHNPASCSFLASGSSEQYTSRSW